MPSALPPRHPPPAVAAGTGGRRRRWREHGPAWGPEPHHSSRGRERGESEWAWDGQVRITGRLTAKQGNSWLPGDPLDASDGRGIGDENRDWRRAGHHWGGPVSPRPRPGRRYW